MNIEGGMSVTIADADILRALELKHLFGNQGRAIGRLSAEGKRNHGLGNYPWEDCWMVAISGADYYLPARCLIPITDRVQPKRKQHTQKEQDNMMNMYQVAIISSPNQLAQQAGKKEEIITTRDVLAGESNAAIAAVAATAAAEILETLKENSIRVIVK